MTLTLRRFAPSTFIAGIAMLATTKTGICGDGPLQGDSANKTSQKGDKAAKVAVDKDENLPEIDLIEGIRTGKIEASAEGTNDGRLAISVKNKSNRQGARRDASLGSSRRMPPPRWAAWAAWAAG